MQPLMLHIIQNDPEVPPGTITENLTATGVMYVVNHPYNGDPLPELRDISALIVLGGAMGANDDIRHPFLHDLKDFIRKIVASGIPYLGVCLGGQLLAAALGARVASNRWDEMGSLPVALTAEGLGDAVFTGLPEVFETFQWHHDSFDIPDDGVLLASSTACRHQAFRIGSCAWATQFHPEVTEQIIRNWCAWDRSTAERSEEFVSAYRSQEDEYRAVSRQLLVNFLRCAGLV